MNTFLLPRADLLPDQIRAVEMPATSHKVVFGPPGSGKTQVLIHRADYLAKAHHVLPEKFRIFVFTKVLKDSIRSSLTMLDLPLDSVTTFDHWCMDTYRARIGSRLPWDAAAKAVDFAAIRREVGKLVQVDKTLRGSLDFALVDEGQDLDNQAFTILSAVARHVTVFADPKQQIFEGGANEQELLCTLGLTRRNATLMAAYRNSPDVSRLAAYFITDSAARAEYLAQSKGTQPVRERHLLFLASTFGEEVDRLAEIVGQRQTANQSVCIVVPGVKQVHGFATGLAERGVVVEKAVSGKGSSPVRFDNNTPKIATYHSAKGLTFDCVLMPRLMEAAFQHHTNESRRRLLFVGITRATQWVFLSAQATGAVAELSLLEEAAAQGALTIQRSRVQQCAPGASGSATDQDEVGDDEDEFSVL